MVTTRLMTAEDVEKLGEETVDHLELIEGELIRMPPAKPVHGWLESNLVVEIGTFARTHHLGEVFGSSAGYYFSHDPDTLLQPDASFIRAERLPPRDDWWSFFEVVPDLVIEIISPSERRAYIQRKVAIYLGAGVRLVWYVDPRRQMVTVYAPNRDPVTLGVSDALDGEDVLPGFRLPLAAIFNR